MDHLEAKGLHASEKYVLGELSADQRDAFEEHYFDCAECAEDVKATLTFVSAGREVFREEPLPVSSAPIVPAMRPRRVFWLRPLIAIPAMAALLLAVVYYTRSSKPPAGVITELGQTLSSSPSFGLRGGDRLENEKTIVRVHDSDPLQLHFDFVPLQTRNFSSYTGELKDSTAHVLLQFNIPPDRVNKEVNLLIPSGLLHSGDYTLAIFGLDPSSSAKSPVGKFTFAVQNNP